MDQWHLRQRNSLTSDPPPPVGGGFLSKYFEGILVSVNFMGSNTRENPFMDHDGKSARFTVYLLFQYIGINPTL